MPTIKDVAKMAGISVTTVSRVFNNRGYLSDAVKIRVKEASAALDYYPNELARSLHSRKSFLIGLIVPSVSNPFYGEFVSCVEQNASKHGYKIVLCNSLHDEDKENGYIKMLKRSQVDGIITGSHTASTSGYENLRLPVVSFDRRINDRIPFVTSDNYTGGRLAAARLIERGAKNLVHVTGALDTNILAFLRSPGFTSYCEERGAKHKTVVLSKTSLTSFSGVDDIRALLKDNPDCDGLFAASDIMAAAVLALCEDVGKKPGKDILVIGFDGNRSSAFLNPSLTTVRQSVEDLSALSVDILLRLMKGEPCEVENVLPVSLLEGRSA